MNSSKKSERLFFNMFLSFLFQLFFTIGSFLQHTFCLPIQFDVDNQFIVRSLQCPGAQSVSSCCVGLQIIFTNLMIACYPIWYQTQTNLTCCLQSSWIDLHATKPSLLPGQSSCNYFCMKTLFPKIVVKTDVIKSSSNIP